MKKIILIILTSLLIFVDAQEEVCKIQSQLVEIESEKVFFINISEKEGKIIEEIIVTMGESSIISISFKSSKLKKLCRELTKVRPLHFLGYIFTNDKLKKHIKAISTSSFKWNALISAITPILNREANSHELYEELACFAIMLKVELKPLEEKAKERKWSDFAKYLIHCKT